MAQVLYTRLQQTAERLIAEFGQTGTIKRITAPDPVLGGDGTETSYTATLVPMAYEARFIDGTVIRTGDVQLYISSFGLPIDPEPGDIAAANGKDYLIVNTDPNRYDGVTPVVHICQGRLA